MNHVCRRCLFAFSSKLVLGDHIERCMKQQPTKISFSWKDHLKFEDHHMKTPLPISVYADFECINQPRNTAKPASYDPKVLFKQIPIAVGYCLIAPLGNQYYSYFSEGCTQSAFGMRSQRCCVSWFVNEMLTLKKFHRNIVKQIYYYKQLLKKKYSSNNPTCVVHAKSLFHKTQQRWLRI